MLVTTQGTPLAMASPIALEKPSPQAEAEHATSKDAVSLGKSDLSPKRKILP